MRSTVRRVRLVYTVSHWLVVCCSRTSLEFSKRWGTLALVNQLLKIYFKVGVAMHTTCNYYKNENFLSSFLPPDQQAPSM